jgi:hypothetical protein
MMPIGPDFILVSVLVVGAIGYGLVALCGWLFELMFK